ncbi:glycosyltransferase family 4 protein [bacterium]|nr:glycosyltransferase family 4 protein [bacterium]
MADEQTAPESIDEPPRDINVALDVRTWGMSGLGTYLAELLAAMARINAPISWTMVGPSEIREMLPAGIEPARWIELRTPIYEPGPTFSYPRIKPFDVWHYPHYNLPLGWSRRCVVNVFDLFHRRYGSWAKRRYQGLFLKRLRWSRATIVTSCEKTRQELIEEWRIKAGRIVKVDLGPGRRPPAARVAPAEVATLAGTPIRPPWLLSLGIDQRHKNFDFVLSALSLYYQRRPDAPPYVWSGLSPEQFDRRVRKMPAWLRDRVALEEYDSPERMEELLAGAAGLVFPSLDEGFGLPPLEAMSRGVPVLCSRREPMTTILGDAPLYFEPTESASLWRVLDHLLDSPSIRQEVVRRGRAQAARYDWDATAREMISIYQSVSSR